MAVEIIEISDSSDCEIIEISSDGEQDGSESEYEGFVNLNDPKNAANPVLQNYFTQFEYPAARMVAVPSESTILPHRQNPHQFNHSKYEFLKSKQSFTIFPPYKKKLIDFKYCEQKFDRLIARLEADSNNTQATWPKSYSSNLKLFRHRRNDLGESKFKQQYLHVNGKQITSQNELFKAMRHH